MPNRITAALTTDETTAIMTLLDEVKSHLPFLLNLTPEERHTLPKMGDKTRAFVAKALEVATQNPDILPRSFDLEEMRRDLELYEALQPLALALTQLLELVNDTSMEAGSEAYVAALMVYQYAKASGQGAGLDSLADALGQRFARKSKAGA